MFVRIKVAIDPERPFLDKLPLLLPGEKSYEILVHYERLQRVCLYCARIGHEVEGCEDRNTILSHIKSYPVELHELMRVRLLPETGRWINKEYLIPSSSSRMSGGGAAAGGRAVPNNIDINEPPSTTTYLQADPPARGKQESQALTRTIEKPDSGLRDTCMWDETRAVTLFSTIISKEENANKRQKAARHESSLPLSQ
jgi:Zinc knuckle